MNDDRTLERAARSWLEEGPVRTPDRAVEAALSRIQSIPQERDLRIPWRLPTMNPIARLVASVAALAVVVVVGLSVLRVGGTGGPPATPSPVPTPTATPGPTPDDAACRLLTAAEVEIGATGGIGVQPGASGTGPTTHCFYSDGGGDIWLQTSLTRPGGAAAFAAATAKTGVQTEQGLAAEAVFDPATGTLYVLQADAMASIRALFSFDTVEQQHAVVLRLAPVLIPRL